jgi:polyhydroxyalkanoate synthesis regulator phasin
MKLNRSTTLMIPLAGVLLVVAAGAVLATSSDGRPPVVAEAAAATPTPAPSAVTTPKVAKVDSVLSQVLDDLVTKGTITADQQKAILDGITTKRNAIQAERKAAREQRQADQKQLRDFLSDGVITKDEFDKLPADSALRKISGLMDDGKITKDELRQAGRDLLNGMGVGMGGRGGKGFFGGKGWGSAASPSASPSTGG